MYTTVESSKVSYTFKNYSEKSKTGQATFFSKFNASVDPILVLHDVEFYQVMHIAKAIDHEIQACRQSVTAELKSRIDRVVI